MRVDTGFLICMGLAIIGMLRTGEAVAQDTTAGKALFTQCSVCHSIDGSNGVGPSLQGVMGRKAGTFPGFRYSRAMKFSGLLWDSNNVDQYLTDPQKALPGNVMPFAGLPDPKIRAALIAYLNTLN